MWYSRVNSLINNLYRILLEVPTNVKLNINQLNNYLLFFYYLLVWYILISVVHNFKGYLISEG